MVAVLQVNKTCLKLWDFAKWLKLFSGSINVLRTSVKHFVIAVAILYFVL